MNPASPEFLPVWLVAFVAGCVAGWSCGRAMWGGGRAAWLLLRLPLGLLLVLACGVEVWFGRGPAPWWMLAWGGLSAGRMPVEMPRRKNGQRYPPHRNAEI
jgi:hypothetical protein